MAEPHPKPHPTAAASLPGETLTKQAMKLRQAIADAIAKRTPKRLDRYNRKWAQGGKDAPDYPATHGHVENFPLAPQVWLNMDNNKVCLQMHPDSERGGNHQVLCTNCTREMKPGTYETHKGDCKDKPPAYKSDPKKDKPAAKKNPWLQLFRDEDMRKGLTSKQFVTIARKGTKFLYLLHPKKNYYMVYCTACGAVVGLNNWQKHADDHRTAVLGGDPETDAEIVFFKELVVEMPEESDEKDDEEEVERKDGEDDEEAVEREDDEEEVEPVERDDGEDDEEEVEREDGEEEKEAGEQDEREDETVAELPAKKRSGRQNKKREVAEASPARVTRGAAKRMRG